MPLTSGQGPEKFVHALGDMGWRAGIIVTPESSADPV